MPSTKDVVLLAVDDATVTLGAQFREVALGLLITALNPSSSSYAWYFLIGSIPGLVLPRVYSWVSGRFASKPIMLATYGARLLMVLGLWRVANFWAALALLAGLSTGGGIYSSAQAHYVAVPDDFAATRQVIMRLRQSESALRLIGPLVAGIILAWSGYRGGFLISAGAYAFALLAVSRLSGGVGGSRGGSWERINWRPDRAALAMFGVSLLTWPANTLAMAYTFHVLHRQMVGYGVELSVWGGSGLLASWVLARISVRPLQWIPPLYAVLGVCWLILSHGVSFPIFIVLGGLEGFAAWLVQDLAAAFILARAPEGHAGHARARLGAFDEMGAIAGTAALLLVPSAWLVRPMYAVVGVLGLLAAVIWWGTEEVTRRRGQGSVQDVNEK